MASTHYLPKQCKVCERPAEGHFYSVPSCNRCKAFFRQTIVNGKRFVCSKTSQCLEVGSVAEASRKRACSACRFAKCVKVGMDPTLIKEDIISKEGKLLIQEIQAVSDESIIRKLEMAESCSEKIRSQNYPHRYMDTRSLLDILAGLPNFNTSNINLSLLSNQIYPHADLAHNAFLCIVEHVKLFDFFRKISLDSSRILLKNVALICNNMTTCYYSLQNFKSDNVRRSDGSVAGKPMRNYNGIWADHQVIIQKTLHAFLRIKLEFEEYMFLKAIVICNPVISNLPPEDQKIIETERLHYAKHFLAYLTHRHGASHGPDRFATLLSLISVFEAQNRDQKAFNVILRYFYQGIPFIVSPLYDELVKAP